MSGNTPSRKTIGGYYFEGYTDLLDSSSAYGYSKAAVFTLPGVDDKPHYVTERQIRSVLKEVERAANSGVEEGRTLSELFSAVRRNIIVHPSVNKARIKPEDLYMLLDGMHDEQVVSLDGP